MATRPQRDPTPDMQPIARADFGEAQARHLLLRAGFGGSPEQVRTLASWGPAKAVDHLLNVQDIPYAHEADESFARGVVEDLTPAQQAEFQVALRSGDEDTLARYRIARQQMQRRDRDQIARMQRWWLARMIESPRPLEEKMTLFWHSHFATSYRTIEHSWNMLQQNRLFRAHALGNFGDLLFRIIRDPAMLAYLDNNRSTRRSPNENLARELMELFALGQGNYSEHDIKEGARALTGYTFRADEFVFIPQQHDDGPKTILGKRGNLDGDAFVTAILEQRACAVFITRKLYDFFVRDLPDDFRQAPQPVRAAVQSLTSTLLASRYEIKPVLRRLLLSRHFYDDANVGVKVKSPAELVAGLARTLRADARDPAILVDALQLMGQQLFFPPNVAGWAGGRAWINTSTLFVRQNIPVYLLTGRKPGDTQPPPARDAYNAQPILDELALARTDPPATICARLARLVLGPYADPQRHPPAQQRIDEALRAGEADPDAPLSHVATRMLLVLTSAPEAQLA